MIVKRNRTAALLLAATLAMSLAGCGAVDDIVRAAARGGSKADEAAGAAAKGADVAEGQKAASAADGENAPAVILEEAATKAGEEGVQTVLEADDDRRDTQSQR